MSPFLVTQAVFHKFKKKSLKISNTVFRLHSTVTFTAFIICSFAFQISWHVADIIDCISDKPRSADKWSKEADEYCKIMGTYTVIPRCDLRGEGAHPYVHGSGEYDLKLYHQLYQWMGIAFTVQALLYYFPSYLWKQLEDGHMDMLVGDLNEPTLDKNSKQNQVQQLIDYLAANLKHYQTYYWSFVFCEVLNLVNVTIQFSVLSRRFGFQNLGPALVKYWSDSSSSSLEIFDVSSSYAPFESKNLTKWKIMRGNADYCYEIGSPLDMYFPTVTKCRYMREGGPGGNEQPLDLLCILRLNYIYAQIHTILWFWLAFLQIVTAIEIIYRFIATITPMMRVAILKSKYPSVPRDEIEHFVSQFKVGDWFLMYQLSKNLPTDISQQVLRGVVSKNTG